MENRPADLRGWATKFNVLCADGRTIRPGSFDDCDGKQVPLVWEHMRDDPKNVLGHAILHTRPEGIYAEAWYNDSESAKEAKIRTDNKDINSFSIYANKLKHKGKDVVHGIIRELSLVLAGANPEALIEFPVLEHGDGSVVEDEAIIYSEGYFEDLPEELEHSSETPEFNPDEIASFNPPVDADAIAQFTPPAIAHSADQTPETESGQQEPAIEHTAAPLVKETVTTTTTTTQEDKEMPNAERTVRDVFNEMNEEQKNVVYFILGEMLNEFGSEDETMKHNAFEETAQASRPTLTRADFQEMMKLGRKEGSLRAGIEAYLENHSDELSHSVYNSDGTAQTYSIADIDLLFPDYKDDANEPRMIARDTAWAGAVMNGVNIVPFKRIKSIMANLTMDEARAKGYIKGTEKANQVFALLKRTTDPQTVYKKQTIDKDDVEDIDDFNVIAWIRKEMKVMLMEEIARAILVGDGRENSDPAKISPEHIRPIWSDNELFTIKAVVKSGVDDAATAKALIRKALKARKEYKGSGDLTFFTTEDWLTEMLLLEDGIGHPLYQDIAALARKLRVNKIITVPVMENVTDEDSGKLAGILVDLKDYKVGRKDNGRTNTFDDFDLDFNQYKYLIESRLSGALDLPFSAIALIVDGVSYVYNETEDYTGNPKAKGYFEKQGTIYRPTNDTSIVANKVYYEKEAEE